MHPKSLDFKKNGDVSVVRIGVLSMFYSLLFAPNSHDCNDFWPFQLVVTITVTRNRGSRGFSHSFPGIPRVLYFFACSQVLQCPGECPQTVTVAVDPPP